jgi:hypothetical protein
MATVAPNLTLGSTSEAVALALDAIVAATTRTYTALTGSSPTFTAAQFINGIINLSGQTAAQSPVPPTAAAIVAAIPNCQIGSAFEVIIINANTSSGAATLQVASGVTLVGTVAIPVTKTQVFRGIVTAVDTPAVVMYGLLTAPV